MGDTISIRPAEKGIAIGELEIRMLIESAVNEFNNTFTVDFDAVDEEND